MPNMMLMIHCNDTCAAQWFPLLLLCKLQSSSLAESSFSPHHHWPTDLFHLNASNASKCIKSRWMMNGWYASGQMGQAGIIFWQIINLEKHHKSFFGTTPLQNINTSTFGFCLSSRFSRSLKTEQMRRRGFTIQWPAPLDCDSPPDFPGHCPLTLTAPASKT